MRQTHIVAHFSEGRLGVSFLKNDDDGRMHVQKAEGQAGAAGVQKGDIIVAINDAPITPDMEQDDVVKVIVGAGRPFAMKLLREVAEEQEQAEERAWSKQNGKSLPHGPGSKWITKPVPRHSPSDADPFFGAPSVKTSGVNLASVLR